jgi:hypothetical protein
MKIPVIKKIVEQYTIEQLQQAEDALLNEQTPAIVIEGDDEGEKLTHVLASIFIKQHIVEYNCDYNTALRAYSQKVRNSIS